MMIAATFFWGFNFPLAHVVVATVQPMEAGLLRFVLAAIVLIGMALYHRQSIPLVRHGFVLASLAVIGVAGFNVLFFLAMQKTSAVNGALIMGTNPLVTAIMAVFILGERPQTRHLIALPIAFAGVALVVLGNGASLSLSMGDALMIGANLSWASYNVMARRWMPSGSPIGNTAAIMIFSTLSMGGVIVTMDTPLAVPGVVAGSALAIMALAGTVMAYMFYNHGIAKLGAGKAALFMNLVPVWAMVTSMAMGVDPTQIQLIGGAVVIAAVMYALKPQPAVAV
jgi:drug/metabolite transporter (DMT)-like permease